MKLTFLGTGTSIGVPAIGCNCEVCRSKDPRDKRLRCSAIIETNEENPEMGLRVLIDCGPDFRQQILSQRFGKIDAVLLTHIHYDHVAGLDDLRPFSIFGDVDIYAKSDVVAGLHQTMPYCFTEHLYPGVPHLNLHCAKPHETITVSRPIALNVSIPVGGATGNGTMIRKHKETIIPPSTDTLQITPICVMHGKLPILGYRIGNLAYITDMKSIAEEEFKYLEGVDTLVVNALRFEKEHHSHQLVGDAIAFSKRVGAKKTYLIHLTHDIGFHDSANSRLPEGFYFPYDGEEISF